MSSISTPVLPEDYEIKFTLLKAADKLH